VSTPEPNGKTETARPVVSSEIVRCAYLGQIKRLKEENRELRDVLVQERLLRQRAYQWYMDRLNSRVWTILDLTMQAWRHRK